MASDKAKELWLRMQFTHGNREDEFDAAVAPLLDALEKALFHVEDLRDAWARGAITAHDGRGGERSNRNVEVAVAIPALLRAWGRQL